MRAIFFRVSFKSFASTRKDEGRHNKKKEQQISKNYINRQDSKLPENTCGRNGAFHLNLHLIGSSSKTEINARNGRPFKARRKSG
jgi:hypothetical protein